MSDLLFFPMSMPDEMLHSRITRYHFLSGNRTEAETFRDLFGSAPFTVGMLPKRIDVLAAKLPGDAENNLDELIRTNTTFPAYRSFLGVSQGVESATAEPCFSGVARIPRREGTVHGKAKLCLTCMQQDLLDLGYAYWHRSHHLPGVSVCWRHGDQLIHACPKCTHPFFRKLRLLPNLTDPCVCGWSTLAPAAVTYGTQLEKRFADFAHELLQRNLPLMSSEALCATYWRQCRKRGYVHGKFTSTAKLFDSIRDNYGDDALSQMDAAYEAGKHDQWIRFTTRNNQMDMPLARHLIIALHLFGSADGFEDALNKELILQGASARSRSKPEKPKIVRGRKSQYRHKIDTILTVRADADLEYLWKNAYQATRWLNENDKPWLMSKLETPKHESVEIEDVSDSRDSAFAAILIAGAEDLYRISKGQKRVNLSNLQKLLPVRLPPDPTTRKRRFPLASQQAELLMESSWHFLLRRLICALTDISRLGLPMNTGSLNVVSSVPNPVFQALVSFFEWDLESFVRNGIDPEVLLKSTGVARDWQGPPGFNVVLGGAAYYQPKPTAELLEKRSAKLLEY
ncbi:MULTISPECIES: TniQ family protein [unclassified Pseudomonas]|uniref:TniQ family protein n=1 Tax=unclassified Pseudomonas TaxID=196821 RepID=UPI00244CB0C5|nr:MULTISPECIES: TniQ family protein [unclassified Pseudomonas]MDG9929062.1 TniQ family protein [Pseudomonas sp. GD04042]MDH0483775.1 TniQ family protein [Pseudomonas sp. GD04015]MDH0604926.1 TniQ family protein [Pseudomonas sp. GD03869]